MDKAKKQGAIDYSYLRPQKAEHLKGLHESFRLKKEELTAPIFRNATILPLKRFDGDEACFGRGGVVDKNGEYLAQSALENFVEKSYSFDKPAVSDKKVVFCGYLINHWGHFLLQAVARLWYFLENDNTIDKYVFFINEGEHREIKGNYREFFELLGILDKLEIISTPTTYSEVVIPELSFAWLQYYSEKFLTIFEKVASNIDVDPSWKKYDKIFFTRSNFKKALNTEIGTPMLDDYYEKNGYQILAPEGIPLRQMIYLIRNSKDCAFVSGTAPHNMVFACDGQHCTILERGAHNNDFQANVNVARKLNVTYIDSNLCVYVVNGGIGPFILSYKGALEKYTGDYHLVPPDKRYTTEKYIKQQLAAYLKRYKQNYYLQIYMEDWLLKDLSHRHEAYVDSLQYLGKYLNGSVPYKMSQHFSVHYWRRCIGGLLRHTR